MTDQGVKIRLIVASEFEIFEASAAAQRVESDVADMVGFEVWAVRIQKVDALVDRLGQPDTYAH